ncbi:heavy-metal-associated domain-containing protein [Propionivibrio limicola]|uniref:heavy-metal-associated domain-containing protein n=1 Tax=Propionivibrio limicola TaxID=167645 RepID=UPI001292467E|nr:heavy-metal-associated domain-containing protein [Propionivibrio limicola]
MERTTIKISGMSCGGCVRNVTSALTAMPGVMQAEVSLEQALATVEFDAVQVSRHQLIDAVEAAGFDAS